MLIKNSYIETKLHEILILQLFLCYLLIRMQSALALDWNAQIQPASAIRWLLVVIYLSSGVEGVVTEWRLLKRRVSEKRE